MLKMLSAFVFSVVFFISASASAHFQLIYSPNSNVSKAGELPLKLVFWHPMENGHAMSMGQPEEFYSVFKGKKTDLKSTLKPIKFKGLSNEADAFDGALKLKRNGDYAVVLVPSPYYEQSEDIYIQQIAKVFINKGEAPTDWAEPIGLPTEILPLNKPYGAIVGSTFSGVVLKEGKPVVGAEIEVEYMVAEPDMKANTPSNKNSSSVPGGAIAVVTDADGKFTFGIPKAGYWGFAALGSGPDTEHKGKELSQDAILWVKAFDLK